MLKVEPTTRDCGFWIGNDEETDDADYVSISGMFGRHNPNTFAQAPDMLHTLRWISENKYAHPANVASVVAAAIAKATKEV